MIRHSRPFITDAELAAVRETLASGELAGGARLARFETALAARVGQQGGVATSSGTAALHLALLALGVGEGDQVVIPSYVCTAVLNAVHHAGAQAVLCDVDPETGNLDPEDARRRFTARTKAVVVAHLFGHPAELGWVQDCGVPVLEDCAQALGAAWRGRAVGSFGAISVFSFYATKVITTGEGGMACSASAELLARMRDLRDYDGQPTYKVRYNYKMSEIQASLGLAQLAQLPALLERRRALAAGYARALAGSAVPLPPGREGAAPIYYRYVVRARAVDRYQEEFARHGIECKRPVFVPLHRLVGGGSFPGADAIYDQALSLPLYPALPEAEQRRVMEVAGALFRESGTAAAEFRDKGDEHVAA